MASVPSIFPKPIVFASTVLSEKKKQMLDGFVRMHDEELRK